MPRSIGVLIGLVMLIACHVNTCVASEPIADLVSEAWRRLPESMDATLIHTRVRRPPDEAKIRGKHLRAMERARKSLHADGRLEAKIEEAIQEEIRWSKQPLVFVRRIRFAGEKQRIDQSILEPGESTATPAQFRQVLVNAGPTEDGHFESWEHQSRAKTAIQNLTRTKPTYRRDEIAQVNSIGESTRLMIRIVTGDKEAAQRGEIAVDKHKVAQLISGTHPEMVISVTRALWASSPAERFDIRLLDNPEYPAAVIYCAVDECSRVYRLEYRDPRTGRLVQTVEQDRFNDSGFPTFWRKETYHADGFLETDEFSVTDVAVNPPIPDDVFEFYVPTGWRSVIRRPEATSTKLPGQAPRILGALPTSPSPSELPIGIWMLFGVITFALGWLLFIVAKRRSRGR